MYLYIKGDVSKLKLHAIFVGLFLVVAHVAMIFGMLNPEIFSANDVEVQQIMNHDM